jgi:hypothetical protein
VIQFGCYGRGSTGFTNITYFSTNVSIQTISYKSGGTQTYSTISRSKYTSKRQGLDILNGQNERLSKYLVYKGFGKDYDEDSNPFRPQLSNDS